MKRKMHEHFMVWGMIVSLIGFGMIIYYRFIDGTLISKPIEFADQFEIQIEKEGYRPGEMVYGYMSFCKHRALTGTIQWNMIDGSLILYPPKEGSVSKGCHNDLRVEIAEVPPYMVIGDTVHFEANLKYEVNPFRTVEIPLKTESFKIIDE